MWGLALGMWTVVSLVGLQWYHFQHTNLFFHSWIDRPSVVASGGMNVLGLGRLVDFVTFDFWSIINKRAPGAAWLHHRTQKSNTLFPFHFHPATLEK